MNPWCFVWWIVNSKEMKIRNKKLFCYTLWDRCMCIDVKYIYVIKKIFFFFNFLYFAFSFFLSFSLCFQMRLNAHLGKGSKREKFQKRSFWNKTKTLWNWMPSWSENWIDSRFLTIFIIFPIIVPSNTCTMHGGMAFRKNLDYFYWPSS